MKQLFITALGKIIFLRNMKYVHFRPSTVIYMEKGTHLHSWILDFIKFIKDVKIFCKLLYTLSTS